MKLRFENDNEFTVFKVELNRRLKERVNRNIVNPELKNSAVMMLLMNKDNNAHVLLTRRTNTVSTHKGQVSFPGGGVDHNDCDILSAAYRETYEEMGIAREQIEYIGQFDDYITISGFHVSCFIGAVAYPFGYRVNSNEIESHFEAPLSLFVNQEYNRFEIYNYKGSDYRVFFYYFNNYEIWGLTARILTDFGEKICRD